MSKKLLSDLIWATAKLVPLLIFVAFFAMTIATQESHQYIELVP